MGAEILYVEGESLETFDSKGYFCQGWRAIWQLRLGSVRFGVVGLGKVRGRRGTDLRPANHKLIATNGTL